MGRIPVAAVLLAGVQVIGVNRESATGAMLPGVPCKARRLKTKLLTEPRLILDRPEPALIPGQVHWARERAACRRVREHVPLGGVAASACVGICSITCACSCPRIRCCPTTCTCSCRCSRCSLFVRHLMRHGALQDGRIVNPRALHGPDGGDCLGLPRLEHLPPSSPRCLWRLRVLSRHDVLGECLLQHVLGARLSVLIVRKWMSVCVGG